jgi:hypothetical protein
MESVNGRKVKKTVRQKGWNSFQLQNCLLLLLEKWENILNYEFHNKNLLLEALTLNEDKIISPFLTALRTSRGGFSQYSI